MQSIINALAIVSFATSAAIVGGGAYVYANRAGLAEKAREKVTEAVTSEVTAMMPKLIKEVTKGVPTPELPSTTGPALPF